MTRGAPQRVRTTGIAVRLRGAARAACLACGVLAGSEAAAQAAVPLQGEGSWTFAYRNLSVHDHIDYLGDRIDRGKTRSHLLAVQLDYGITDRLAVSVGVPYIRARYEGGFPHEFDAYPAHRTEQEIDDGRSHGGWQDWNLALRYQLRTEPFVLTPFVRLGYPTRDYPYHGHSAIGLRTRSLEFGAEVDEQFAAPLDRFYVQAGYGYSVREKVQGIRIRSSTLNLSLGYFFTPRASGRLLAVWLKGHNGLDFPVDFPPPPSELRFNHDRLQRTDSVNLGVGLSYQLGERYVLFGNWLTTVDGKNAHAIHNAYTIGVNRSF